MKFIFYQRRNCSQGDTDAEVYRKYRNHNRTDCPHRLVFFFHICIYSLNFTDAKLDSRLVYYRSLFMHMIGQIMVILPKLSCSASQVFLEKPRKVGMVFVAKTKSDFFDIHICIK
ncbi:hypothetical protein D3C86_757230 [compost metagenome]